ncbi:MAG: cupin domain-containing protein [Dehalococcoidia bacterium]
MTADATQPGILVRAGEAETLTLPNNSATLFAEGKDTGDAFSALRFTMGPGSDGARPHHHAKASELFFIIEGAVDILVGDSILTARAGDLAVVVPGAMHAFANASATDGADVLIIFGPAIERFDYFRMLRDVVAGKTPGSEILATQERFDNWFSGSEAWSAHRAAAQQRG